MPSHAKRLMKLNVLSSECRAKIYFRYAESRKTTNEIEFFHYIWFCGKFKQFLSINTKILLHIND